MEAVRSVSYGHGFDATRPLTWVRDSAIMPSNTIYPSFAWRKFFSGLLKDNTTNHQPLASFGEWVCRKWHDAHLQQYAMGPTAHEAGRNVPAKANSTKLLTWRLVYLLLNTSVLVPPGSPLPIRKNETRWSHRCAAPIGQRQPAPSTPRGVAPMALGADNTKSTPPIAF